jgi:ankyrin repeat protein
VVYSVRQEYWEAHPYQELSQNSNSKGAKKAVTPDAAEERHPDPNGGPTRSVWSSLISIQADDLHSGHLQSSPLLSAVVGQLYEIAEQCIAYDVDVNATDAAGRTALMYAFVEGTF